MNTRNVFAVLNTLLFLGTIAVNALANILPINGMNTGEVSALYPSLFTPAGITFSIWSVIYLSLLVFVVFQWSLREKKYFTELSILFMLSCVLNIIWILVWHHLLIFISVIIMLIFLFVLIRIFLLLQNNIEKTTAEQICLHFPFTIYLAWICVATIANISALLTSLDWDGGMFSKTTWTVIMMSVAAALAVFIVSKFYRYAFGLVVIWALTGIALNHQPVITNAAIVIIIILVCLSMYTYIRRRKLAH